LTRAGLAGKVNEIYIYPATEGAPARFYRSENGKLIVGFRVNRADNATHAVFQAIALGEIQPEVVSTQ